MPPDGNYEAWVQGWSAAATTFDVVINAVQGNALAVTNIPAGPYQPNQPIAFNVNWTLPASLAAGEAAEGLIVTGPVGAASAVQIPVRLHNITTVTKTATFAALGDTYLQSAAPTTNYGTAPFLHTRVASGRQRYPAQPAGLRCVRHPAGVSDREGRVCLSTWIRSRAARWTGNSQAHEVTTAWAENTATWKTPWLKPGGDFVDTAVGDVPVDKSMVGQWITIDVTPLVAKWTADPASNHGLMLRLRKVSSITGYRFVSAENWVPAHAPKLEVTYRKP